MGDFDRHEKPKTRTQTKQVAIAITLGVGLIAVLGVHFMKPGPQTASAADGGGGGGGVPALSPNDTPEHWGDELLKDQTKDLLTGKTVVDPRLNKVPENPFVMDHNWRDSLIRRGPGPVGPIEPVNNHTPDVKVAPPLNLQTYKLGSIVKQGQDKNYMAILNGQIVSPGMVIDGARIIEIRADRVVLQHADFKDGPKYDLFISGKLNP